MTHRSSRGTVACCGCSPPGGCSRLVRTLERPETDGRSKDKRVTRKRIASHRRVTRCRLFLAIAEALERDEATQERKQERMAHSQRRR